jgi:hypothetical protein
MTSEPASLSNQGRDADRDDPLDAAKVPLKQTSLDIASQMRSVKEAEPDLARAVGDYSTSVKQTLGVIEAIEETLQHKRKQIDVIQARQAALAREYRELGKTLELATKDLARQFTGIIHSPQSSRPPKRSPKPPRIPARPAPNRRAAAHPTRHPTARPTPRRKRRKHRFSIWTLRTCRRFPNSSAIVRKCRAPRAMDPRRTLARVPWAGGVKGRSNGRHR